MTSTLFVEEFEFVAEAGIQTFKKSESILNQSGLVGQLFKKSCNVKIDVPWILSSVDYGFRKYHADFHQSVLISFKEMNSCLQSEKS